MDLTKVEDEFEKLRYQINQKLSEVETFLAKKEEYKGNEGRDVYEKRKISDKIDDGLSDIESNLNKLNTTLRSQKSKPKKYGDVSGKEQVKALMEEKFTFLKNRHEGLPVDEKKVEDNRTNLEKLNQILIERAEQEYNDREPNEHEIEAMEKWKKEIGSQDVQLQEIGLGVKELKGRAKNIGKKIDETGKQIKKTSENAKKTEKKLETTNAKLKDLLNKIRSGDKICVDIILILICLGLIAVLYNIIKNKFVDNTSTTATTSKTFLYI